MFASLVLMFRVGFGGNASVLAGYRVGILPANAFFLLNLYLAVCGGKMPPRQPPGRTALHLYFE
jgi:hypothetical protein